MASQAHRAFPRDQPSSSPFLGGAKTVGHIDDFRVQEVGVRAGDTGTETRYGSDRFCPSGSSGGAGCVVRRRVIVSACFRMRLRCPKLGASRPLCLSHLVTLNKYADVAQGVLTSAWLLFAVHPECRLPMLDLKEDTICQLKNVLILWCSYTFLLSPNPPRRGEVCTL